MPRLPLADWQAESARLTVFPMPDATTRSTEWWEAVTESEPDETKTNPKKGSALIRGPFDPGSLILRLEPDRVDWVLKTKELDVEELAQLGERPALGPANEMVDVFSDIAQKWLTRDDLPAIARMAFGTILKHPETDRQAAYLRLPDYVPVQVDPESSDFSYQINLPRVASATGIEGLLLNRLSKWSVAMWQSYSLRLTGEAVQAQAAPRGFALRLELDINTVPAFEGPIPHARLVEIYRELAAAGLAIATDGVVAE